MKARGIRALPPALCVPWNCSQAYNYQLNNRSDLTKMAGFMNLISPIFVYGCHVNDSYDILVKLIHLDDDKIFHEAASPCIIYRQNIVYENSYLSHFLYITQRFHPSCYIITVHENHHNIAIHKSFYKILLCALKCQILVSTDFSEMMLQSRPSLCFTKNCNILLRWLISPVQYQDMRLVPWRRQRTEQMCQVLPRFFQQIS